MANSTVKMHRLATAALDSLSESDRAAVLEMVESLRRLSPDQWPSDRVMRLNGSIPKYMVHVTPELLAFISRSPTGELEVRDIMFEEHLRWLQESQRNAGVPE